MRYALLLTRALVLPIQSTSEKVDCVLLPPKINYMMNARNVTLMPVICILYVMEIKFNGWRTSIASAY